KVSFTAAALYPDIRILEYSGMDSLSPVDVTSSATGSTATSSTPPVVTTTAPDLLFAANTVATYGSSAPLGGSGRWVMQMVAFKATSTSPPPPPTAPTNLAATAAGTS